MEDYSWLGSIPESMWGFLGLQLMLIGKWVVVWRDVKKKENTRADEAITALNKVSDIEQKLDKHIFDDDTRHIRSELCRYIQNFPNEVHKIEELAEEYHSRGQNGSVNLIIEKWRNEHGDKKI